MPHIYNEYVTSVWLRAVFYFISSWVWNFLNCHNKNSVCVRRGSRSQLLHACMCLRATSYGGVGQAVGALAVDPGVGNCGQLGSPLNSSSIFRFPPGCPLGCGPPPPASSWVWRECQSWVKNNVPSRTGNKSRPKSKCDFNFIPGLFADIDFFIPYGNICLKKTAKHRIL